MPDLRKAGGILVFATAALAACSSYGPGGVAYFTHSTPSATGATMDGAGGAVSGGTPAGPHEKEQDRGNTPPGMDRDGHGPAAGAIVDPTGAATRRKPY